MSQLSTYYQTSYDGGLNDTAAPTEIAPNQATLLRNWDITYQGQLRRRDGLTLTGGTLSANPITGLGAFIRNGGQDLLAMEGTNLYYLNGAVWAKLDSGFTNTAGLRFAMENIQVLGKIFIGNEDNTLHTWDRGGTTLNSCLTDLGADVPHGNVLAWYQNYMLTLNNVNVSGTKYPNRLYISNFGDPTTWTIATDYIDLPGDGRAITAVDLGTQLVIFKERAIQYLSGYGVNSWKITASASNVANISEEVGCPAVRGATRVGNEVWFIDNQAQIRRVYQTDFDAFRHNVISKNIQGTLSGLNKGQLSQAVAWSWNNKVYFAFPNGTDTHNSLVCVYDLLASSRGDANSTQTYTNTVSNEAWTTYTGWTPNLFCDYPTSTTIDLYMGDATTGKVYKHAGQDDNGAAIDARWDGKDDYYGAPERYKRYKFGYARANSGTSDANIGLYGSVDAGPFAQFEPINLMSGGTRLGPTGPARMGPTGTWQLGGSTTNTQKFFFTTGGGNPSGRSFRFSIRHNAASQQPAINTWSAHYKPRNLR